jgi:hypothetical protein
LVGKAKDVYGSGWITYTLISLEDFMSHNMPRFPATCDVYRNHFTAVPPQFYVGGSPALTGIKCEVIGRMQGGDTGYVYFDNPLFTPYGWTYYPSLILMYFEKGTDIRGSANQTSGPDSIVTSDGWQFMVLEVFPIAHKFDNEFLGALVASYMTGSVP